MFVVPNVTPDWITLGVFLEVPYAKLRTIEMEESKNLTNACIKMFAEWLKGDSKRSWKKVLEAITESSGAGISNYVERRLMQESVSVSDSTIVLSICNDGGIK